MKSDPHDMPQKWVKMWNGKWSTGKMMAEMKHDKSARDGREYCKKKVLSNVRFQYCPLWDSLPFVVKLSVQYLPHIRTVGCSMPLQHNQSIMK
jgi:hypothetical protein